MAQVLSTGLKHDGEFWPEGTELSALPNKVRGLAKDLDILRDASEPEPEAELEEEPEDDEDGE